MAAAGTKYLQVAIIVICLLVSFSEQCNVGPGNFGAGNVGLGNLGFHNVGVFNSGRRNIGVFNRISGRTIGVGNILAHRRIGVGNILTVPNVIPGRRRRAVNSTEVMRDKSFQSFNETR